MAIFNKINFIIATCFVFSISMSSLADEETNSICVKICQIRQQLKILNLSLGLETLAAFCKCDAVKDAASVEQEKAEPEKVLPRGKRPARTKTVPPPPPPPPPPEKPVQEPPAPPMPTVEPPAPEKPVVKPPKRKPRSAYEKVLPLPEKEVADDEDDEDFVDQCPRICSRRLGREYTGETFIDSRTDKKACGCLEDPRKKD